MAAGKPANVFGKDGLHGELIGSPNAELGDNAQLVLDDGRSIIVPTALLQRREEGNWYLPLSACDLEGATMEPVDRAGVVVPLAEERAEVGKRKVQTGGVRVSTHVREREEVVDLPLEKEEVEIERVAVGRVVETMPEIRREGDTLIVPLVEEVLVVEKRLVLREEVRVTTRRSLTHQPQRVKLRSEEAEIERLGPSARRDHA
ncbi:MAG TPA: YsnF/AvaK domain-containing protein [Tepidisphaeraceae bacterium]|jgi:uncharacterized protein (TIGR02271 family)|nr:YsnF/AvaK domain-containing protein [Tepidisphaeraceae bacterium]